MWENTAGCEIASLHGTDLADMSTQFEILSIEIFVCLHFIRRKI